MKCHVTSTWTCKGIKLLIQNKFIRKLKKKISLKFSKFVLSLSQVVAEVRSEQRLGVAWGSEGRGEGEG